MIQLAGQDGTMCRSQDPEVIMRAVAVPDFGSEPEVMELPVPRPGAGEILLRVHAAGMNPFDWKAADGALRDTVPHAFPLILGNDAAGVVEQAGPGATRFRPGDRVFGQVLNLPRGQGSYAEYVLASQDGHLALIPDGLPFTVAAALPTASMAAYNAIEASGTGSGQAILINGATGGVGQSAVQFAATRGATVLATATPEMAGHLRDLGAHHIIDFTQGSTAEQVRAVRPGGVDAVLDLISTPASASALDELATLVRPGGILLSTNGAADTGALAAHGIRAVNFYNSSSAGLLATLGDLARSGKLRIRIDRQVPLAEAPAAIAAARTGHARGKTVIIPDGGA
jgi:NADPH:quinone reductase-like Zn-dependent oxidoreductase